jgi:hypothetical protein
VDLERGLHTASDHAAAIASLDGGGTLRTLDGGRSWHSFRLRYAARFATPTIGLGVRSYMVDRHLALALVATSDGGLTWQSAGEPLHPGDRRLGPRRPGH